MDGNVASTRTVSLLTLARRSQPRTVVAHLHHMTVAYVRVVSSKIPSKISDEKGHYEPILDGLANRISPARGHNPKLHRRTRSDLYWEADWLLTTDRWEIDAVAAFVCDSRSTTRREFSGVIRYYCRVDEHNVFLLARESPEGIEVHAAIDRYHNDELSDS